jgi:rhamnogalacturonyl hydrolase YesR
MSMAELLSVMPEDHPQRAAILKLYRAHAQGLATLQAGSGLWHQMLDRQDTFLETSCTAMYTYAIARGVNRGWLDPGAYGPVAIAGWNGLTTKISRDGHLSDVCPGTSYAADYIYYYHRPAVDDIHGYGPTLLAGAEIINMLKNSQLRIEVGPNQPLMVFDRRLPPPARY